MTLVNVGVIALASVPEPRVRRLADVLYGHTRVEHIATDRERQTIPWVRVTDGEGKVTEYVAGGVAPEAPAAGERRGRDCTEGHNRQGHLIAALKEVEGEPFAIERRIAERLTAFYSQRVSDGSAATGSQIALTIAAAQRIYTGNVFPAMHVTFGTYPSNLGHLDSAGCFRCHDDLHKSTGGAVINQDCERCHKTPE